MRHVGLRYLGFASAGILIGAAAVSACSSDTGGTAVNAGGSGNVGGSGGSVSGGTGAFAGGGIGASSGNDGGLDPDSACAQQSAEATLVKKPVDVIFIVDNSCSMTNEIISVEQNIGVNFSNIIQASGIDYRVIMIAEQGPANPDESICIGPPLGGTSCPVAANQPPVNNPPIFYHYDNNDVESHDSWCKMINWYDKPDRYGLAPNGWREWLRPDSFKAFVELTDDGVGCTAGTWTYNDSNSEAGGQTAAQQFDADLLARDPAMFGTAAQRNYIWYSILGIGGNPANPTQAWSPTEAMTLSECTTAIDPGTGYQALSILTGGLRFPICEGAGFDVVFQEIAKGVIQGAKVACEFDVPTPPDGKQIDLNTVEVEYTPGGGGIPGKFTKVNSLAECKPNAFYIEGDKIKLCPETCALVETDDQAKLQVLFGCKVDGPA
jgi:hypothetical protein